MAKTLKPHSLAETRAVRQAVKFRDAYFKSGVWDETTWLGRKVLKPVGDLWLYQEVIARECPAVILETGTRWGGSAWFFGSVCELLGLSDTLVISVDLDGSALQHHPNIRYVTGDSVAETTLAAVKDLAPDGLHIVSLDSDHSPDHVRREIELYAPLVVRGGLLVVEDTWIHDKADPLRTWDSSAQGFELDEALQDKFLMSFGKWYRKIT